MFVNTMMDRFEKMALMIANIPHHPQNTGPASSAFDGSFMQGSFFDDNFENYMPSSGDQTGFLLIAYKQLFVLFYIW